MINFVSACAIIAGTLTTACFVPQAYRAIKSENTKAISLVSYILLNLGVVLWAIYGALVKNLEILMPNVITFVFAFLVLIKKIHNIKTGVDK
jgi:MtN3 and saliva related transmembrane protein